MAGKAIDIKETRDKEGHWIARFNYLDRSKINPKTGKPGIFFSCNYVTETKGSRKTAEKEFQTAFDIWKARIKNGEVLTKSQEKERQEQEFHQAELKKKEYEQNPTINELIEWYVWSRKSEVKPGTIETWNHQFRPFAEEFGQMKIVDLSPEMLNIWIKKLFNSGLKYSSCSTYYDTFRCFFTYLAENKRISESPMKDLKKPKKPKATQVETKNKALSFEDFHRFEAALQNEPPMKQAMLKLMGYTGLRRGEIAVLEWKDFDFKNKVLYVTKNAQIAKSEGGWYITTPKSGLSRTIPLPNPAIQVMKEWQRIQAMNNLIKKGITENKYCFEGRDGSYFNPTAISNYFKWFSKKYGIEDFHPHKLRHTFATYYVVSGSGDIVSLQHILGHADLSTTQKYTHANEDAKRQAMNNFGVFIDQIENRDKAAEKAEYESMY